MAAVTACKDASKSESSEIDKTVQVQDDSLMKEVVMVHDNLMNYMGVLTDLEMELELASKDSVASQLMRLEEVRNANTEMFAWMQDFGTDFTFEEINKGQELSAEKQKLLQAYHERIVLLQEEVKLIFAEEE